MLAFSGGGTRAAAFSYGVLEELRRTEVVVDGQHRRLLDEVDLITGVSGGSFTALSYALYGDKLFSEYETRFLKRNVQGALLGRSLNPFNWPNLIGGSYGRSELAADYYDEILFQGATFADLRDKPTPTAVAGGTDLTNGARFAFSQNDFDMLCSDLNKVRLARAAATSSAVPVVLSPVTFNNYAGRCDYKYPAWLKDVIDHNKDSVPAKRLLQRYHDIQDFRNSKDHPYIHLVDGGLADNLGVRAILEAIDEFETNAAFREAFHLQTASGSPQPRSADRGQFARCAQDQLGQARVTARDSERAAAILGRADVALHGRFDRSDEGHGLQVADTARAADPAGAPRRGVRGAGTRRACPRSTSSR